MLKYIFFRSLGLIPLLIVVAVLSFLLIDLIPGSAAEVMLGDMATAENVAALEAELGLSDPFVTRFGRWFGAILHGDLGNSIRSSRPVRSLLLERLPATLSIVSGGMLIGTVFGLLIGIASGLYPGSILDRLLTVLTSVTVAIPSFWLGLMLAIWFAVDRGWFPAVSYAPLSDGIASWLHHLILPSLALAVPTAAMIARQTRSSMAYVLQTKYIQAARANGLPRGKIVLRHVLRNALIPVVTVIGFRIAVSIGQAFVVERVFNLKGVGDLLADAVLKQDVPVVQGGLILVACVVVLSSLMVDVSYTLLNPKVRL